MSIEDLPDVPLIRIFFFLDLENLLLIINRVCTRFYNLHEKTPVLWKICEFYEHLIIKEEDFPYIFQHAIKFNFFNIIYCTYTGHHYSFDYYCVTKLSNSNQLTWLNLTGTPISTTCFLQLLPNLEILDLSQCPNLNDNDFHAASVCHKLKTLHLSFSYLDPKTVQTLSHVHQLYKFWIFVEFN